MSYKCLKIRVQVFGGRPKIGNMAMSSVVTSRAFKEVDRRRHLRKYSQQTEMLNGNGSGTAKS